MTGVLFGVGIALCFVGGMLLPELSWQTAVALLAYGIGVVFIADGLRALS